MRELYLDQPAEVSFETLSLCNASCNFCPYPTLERKGSEMPTEIIYNLLGQMQKFKHPFTISPFKVNEPFLDSRLMNILLDVSDNLPNANIRIFTNGSKLNQEYINRINLLKKVEHLWISLNEVNPNTYKKVMGLKFDLTASKLDLLHRNVIDGFKHPVILSAVVHKELDAHNFVQYCINRWPKFLTHMIKQDGWLGYVDPLYDKIPDRACGRWFELSILSTGVVSLCCMDGKGEFPIGNIYQNTLLEIYNSPHWRERREKMLSRLQVYPCNTCTY